ncbi:hypothetical protein ANN_23201 [Periplaneta americana]|uniref:Uncharacterized protein n=1 Tax=Periplaneta americana TaxID=6978 RepID=A0ABQ8SKF8_PERAM|nr:hypothetical protein ANN_23201 [Periplaneta americana]
MADLREGEPAGSLKAVKTKGQRGQEQLREKSLQLEHEKAISQSPRREEVVGRRWVFDDVYKKTNGPAKGGNPACSGYAPAM